MFDPSEVLEALRRTGRVYVCLVLDVPVPAGDETVNVRNPPILVVTNVVKASDQSSLLRQGAAYLDRQEELHGGKSKTSN